MVAFVSPDWPRYSRIAQVGSQAAQPHLEYGSTYNPLRPTRLDEIKNFHPPVQVGDLSRGTCQPFSLRLPSCAGKAFGCLSLD